MRKFGLIGGMSWHSTVEYYATINRLINDYHGDNTNPPLWLVNLNQKQMHDFQRADNWGGIAKTFIEAALELQGLGVEGIALCANTPHKVFDQLSSSLSCSVLHIADAIGLALKEEGVGKAGLLGTRFTMSQDFIKDRLLDRYQIDIIVPTVLEQDEMQVRIYQELVLGTFDDNTKALCLGIIDSLAEQGAEAVILGCTELPLLLKDASCPIPVVDSLGCHCKAIAEYILH